MCTSGPALSSSELFEFHPKHSAPFARFHSHLSTSKSLPDPNSPHPHRAHPSSATCFRSAIHTTDLHTTQHQHNLPLQTTMSYTKAKDVSSDADLKRFACCFLNHKDMQNVLYPTLPFLSANVIRITTGRLGSRSRAIRPQSQGSEFQDGNLACCEEGAGGCWGDDRGWGRFGRWRG